MQASGLTFNPCRVSTTELVSALNNRPQGPILNKSAYNDLFCYKSPYYLTDLVAIIELVKTMMLAKFYLITIHSFLRIFPIATRVYCTFP